MTSIYFFSGKNIVSTRDLNKFMVGGILRYRHM